MPKMPKKRWVYVGPQSIPEPMREALTRRIQQHASEKWQGHYREIIVRFRGKFAYIDALTPLDEFTRARVQDKEQLKALERVPIHLCRLRYLGREDEWEFAFYKYSDERYELCYLPSGSFTGTPEECFDCAAEVYLRG